MQKEIKVFPLRLSNEYHQKLKDLSEASNKSMHQFVLDAIDCEEERSKQEKETFELIRLAYQSLKGGPAPDIEELLFNWLLTHNK